MPSLSWPTRRRPVWCTDRHTRFIELGHPFQLARRSMCIGRDRYGPDPAAAIDGRTGAGVPMILCISAPPLRLKNPFIRSIASEHKPSTPAMAAAINRRSIKERKLSVLHAIDEGLPASQQQLLLTDQSQRGGDTADPTVPSESVTLLGSQQHRDVYHTPVCGEHLLTARVKEMTLSAAGTPVPEGARVGTRGLPHGIVAHPLKPGSG
jgi:hypothetical protein